jgi:hypothetical protein
MAFVLHRYQQQLPIKAASSIPPRTAVRLSASSPLQVLAIASNNDALFGMIGDATAAQGEVAAIYDAGNIVKAIAAASLGAGAEVAVASIGVASSAQRNAIATTTLFGPITVASGAARWAAGVAMDAVAAGEVFSLYIRPRLTGGLA